MKLTSILTLLLCSFELSAWDMHDVRYGSYPGDTSEYYPQRPANQPLETLISDISLNCTTKGINLTNWHWLKIGYIPDKTPFILGMLLLASERYAHQEAYTHALRLKMQQHDLQYNIYESELPPLTENELKLRRDWHQEAVHLWTRQREIRKNPEKSLCAALLYVVDSERNSSNPEAFSYQLQLDSARTDLLAISSTFAPAPASPQSNWHSYAFVPLVLGFGLGNLWANFV